MKKERKKRACGTEHSCIARQCITEYSEKVDVSAKQRCAIKFCVHLNKTQSEMTKLLKDAFGREMFGDLTIWQ